MTIYVISSFSGEFEFLSNFHRRSQCFNTQGKSIWFHHAEGAFQAAKHKYLDASKADREAFVKRLAKEKSPSEARKIGKSVSGLDIEAWDLDKISVMRQVLISKFNSDEMSAKLLSTGDAMLVEGNTWGDRFWGRCEGKGYNILGVILMEIRGYHRMHNHKWPVGSENE